MSWAWLITFTVDLPERSIKARSKLDWLHRAQDFINLYKLPETLTTRERKISVKQNLSTLYSKIMKMAVRKSDNEGGWTKSVTAGT